MTHPTATATRFEAWSATYERSALQPILYAPAHRAALRLAQRHMPRPRRILDLGCGTGRLLRSARACYPQADLVGADLAWTMLTAAAAASPTALRIGYVRAPAERLPFAREVFDLVLATLSVRHWTDPPGGLLEIGRVLDSGGVLVVADVFRGGQRRRGAVRAPWRRRVEPPADLVDLLAVGHLVVIGWERAPSLGLPDVQVVAACKPRDAAASRPGPGGPAALQRGAWRADGPTSAPDRLERRLDPRGAERSG